MKRNNILLILFVLLAVILACLAECKASPKQDTSIIRITISTTPNEWELAEELSGHDVLKESGLKYEMVPSLDSSGMNGMMAILGGKLDIAGGGWVGWINVRARGGKIKAVLPGFMLPEDKKGGILVLKDSNIYTIKDLKGKTVGVNILGLTGEYTLRLLLKKFGVPEDSVTIIPVPTNNQEQALRSRQLDAMADTMCGGTAFDRALDHGGLRLLPDSGNREVQGENVATGTGFREDFIEKYPGQVRSFSEACENARDIIWENYKKDPERVRRAYAVIAKRKGGNPDLAKYYSPGFSPDHRFIKEADVQWWINLLVSQGKLKPGQIKSTDIYTNKFNPSYKKAIK
jgi:ABC-type nitrate/sulfonate/bicarbonate transport system substrate-binding protein